MSTVFKPPVAVAVHINDSVLLILKAVYLTGGLYAPDGRTPCVGHQGGARVQLASARVHVGVVQHVTEDLVRGLWQLGSGVGVQGDAGQALHLVQRPEIAILCISARSGMDGVHRAVKHRDPAAEVVPGVVGLVVAEKAVFRGGAVEGGGGVYHLAAVHKDPDGVPVQQHLKELLGAGVPCMGHADYLAIGPCINLSDLDGRARDPDVQVVGGVRLAEAEATVVGGIGTPGEVAPEGHVGVAKVHGG